MLPLEPGVYWFTSSTNKLLYVGKAKNLKNRISSYKHVASFQKKTFKLVQTAKLVNFKVLGSEIEALLVEARLIGTYKPEFNTLLKDDKSPLYLIVTNDKFPRVISARKNELATTYRQIPSNRTFGPFSKAKDVTRLIKLLRATFKFCSSAYKKTDKPCFYYHLDQCDGACVSKVSLEQYHQKINYLLLFLSGKKRRLLKELNQQMRLLSNQKKYEQAAVIRDQIATINQLYLLTNLFDQIDSLPILEEDLSQTIIDSIISQLARYGVELDKLTRIECYDISHTGGTSTTASMVVLEHGKPQKDQYRRFKIRSVDKPNDFQSMKEVISRRMTHSEWPKPDLIVVDGGKGQVSSVIKLTDTIPVIGIAKRPDRLIIPVAKTSPLSFVSLVLESGTALANLTQLIRDEAHRFAKSYHIKLRSKQLITI